MTTKNQSYLTPDGHLPDNLDWDIEVQVKEHDQTRQVLLHNLDWEFALHYGGPDITEMLTSPGSVYHERLDDHLEIGYTFHFKVDDQGRIIAEGTVHPARITPDANYTHFDTVIHKADLVIIPKDPRTTEALKEYILNNA